MGAVVDRGESIESKLDEATGKAADLRDAFVRTSAEVDTKLGQLGSHSAAAAHVLSKLSEANIEANGVMERTAKMVKEAQESGENTKTETERLIKDVSSVTDKAEAAAGETAVGTEHAAEFIENVEERRVKIADDRQRHCAEHPGVCGTWTGSENHSPRHCKRLVSLPVFHFLSCLNPACRIRALSNTGAGRLIRNWNNHTSDKGTTRKSKNRTARTKPDFVFIIRRTFCLDHR